LQSGAKDAFSLKNFFAKIERAKNGCNTLFMVYYAVGQTCMFAFPVPHFTDRSEQAGGIMLLPGGRYI
jgi:hypothetical protein